jgi:hypothetical protein
MKIPFQDTRTDMCRRWTDFRRLQEARFMDLYESVEESRELGRAELEKLQSLINEKLQTFYR